MALVHCPACGKEVSDKAKHCVHCGAEFYTCPECNHITVETPEECPNCGYIPPKQETAPAEVRVEEAKVIEAQVEDTLFDDAPVESGDIVELWKTCCPKDATRAKVWKIVSKVFGACYPVLLLIAMICILLTLGNGNATDGDLLSGFFKTDLLVAFSSVAWVASTMISTIIWQWQGIRCANWARNHNVDFKPFLIEHKEEINNRNLHEQKFAAYYLYYPEGRNGQIILTVLTILFEILAEILFVVFVRNILLAMAMGTLFEAGLFLPLFLSSLLPFIIPAVVVGTVGFVLNIIQSKKLSSKVNEILENL